MTTRTSTSTGLLGSRAAIRSGRPVATVSGAVSEACSLEGAPAGQLARITAVGAGGDRRRLAELGLRPGALVTVVRRTSGGGRLLALGADRVAVDKATARRVSVAL